MRISAVCGNLENLCTSSNKNRYSNPKWVVVIVGANPIGGSCPGAFMGEIAQAKLVTHTIPQHSTTDIGL